MVTPSVNVLFFTFLGSALVKVVFTVVGGGLWICERVSLFYETGKSADSEDSSPPTVPIVEGVIPPVKFNV